jgi:hypothetical protein
VTWYIEPVRDRPRVDPVTGPRQVKRERTEAEREAARERGGERRRERREEPEDDGLPHVDVLA